MPEPVAVKRLRVRDKVVEFPDGPILDCRFAARLGQWASDLVIPVVFGGLGTELKAVRTGPGFECRNRNHASSGKLSAHATGLAVDVAGFDLANGNHLLVTEATDEARFAYFARFELVPVAGSRRSSDRARTQPTKRTGTWTS